LFASSYVYSGDAVFRYRNFQRLYLREIQFEEAFAISDCNSNDSKYWMRRYDSCASDAMLLRINYLANRRRI